MRPSRVKLVTDGKQRPDAAPNLTWWLQLLARYGEAPAHLQTPRAYHQALDIARELAARGHGVKIWQQALPDIAYAVMHAVALGKRIYSLGFIAEALARKVDNGDRTWAFGIPSVLSTEEHAQAYEHAHRWVQGLEAAEYPVNRDAKLGTIEVENLSWYLRQYGIDVVVAGIDARLAGKAQWPKEGRRACAWSAFRSHEVTGRHGPGDCKSSSPSGESMGTQMMTSWRSPLTSCAGSG